MIPRKGAPGLRLAPSVRASTRSSTERTTGEKRNPGDSDRLSRDKIRTQERALRCCTASPDPPSGVSHDNIPPDPSGLRMIGQASPLVSAVIGQRTGARGLEHPVCVWCLVREPPWPIVYMPAGRFPCGEAHESSCTRTISYHVRVDPRAHYGNPVSSSQPVPLIG